MKFLYTFRLAESRNPNNGSYQFPVERDLWQFTNYDETVAREFPNTIWRMGGDETLVSGPWEPALIQHDAFNWSQEQSNGDLKITVARDNPVAALFRDGQPPSSVWLQIWLVDDGALGALPCWLGRVKHCEFHESDAVLFCQLIDDMLRRPALIQKFNPGCGWAVYEQRTCGLDRNAEVGGVYKYRVDGTLDAVSADKQTLTSSAFATKPDGFFNQGLVDIGGQSRMVLTHTGSTVRLFSAVQALEPGQSFSAYRGCDRSKKACNALENIPNFGGFDIPSTNIWLKGVPF